jgi:hypothetical protein
MRATASNVVELRPPTEAWVTKQQLAKDLGCSTRFLNYRMNEGLPSRRMFGRPRFQRSVAESWLVEHGYMEDG